ncbi:PP2C family protein-serine/threonine phosphatase [Pseudooceanicola sp. 200-1SW]|uniref:PP2C family protein-serine/threonine phosphatase n=1 Tax=Pseudooceanicola sp. 200-1SW TaxID=3425949 RepID=UPI003D7F2D7E
MTDTILVPPLKVVVADDDALQRAHASALLRSLGYDPYEADDGARALELVRELGARILLCDLDMPALDGHELARHVRADKTEHYVHIIMVTSQSQTSERLRALEAGVDDFMAKPLDRASLTARIRSADRLLRHEMLLAERNRVLAEAKEQIEADLRAAASAQRRMLPAPRAQLADCTFHSAFRPSNILSGDMFAYYQVAPGYTGFYSIDVAGHGVHASLLSVALGHLLTAEYFRRRAFDEAGKPDPAALVTALNERFFRQDSTEYFTMFCGILDQTSGSLHYCQAGAPSPMAVTRDGATRMIGDGGFPVALLDQASFENRCDCLMAGESLVVFSDGATEAESLTGEPFGEERFRDVLVAAAATPGDIPGHMVEALTRWRSGRALEDDLTILVCERTR